MDRLLYQIQDVLPAVLVFVVLAAAAVLVGVGLERVRRAARRGGTSRPARALRTLEAAAIPHRRKAGFTVLRGRLVGEPTVLDPVFGGPPALGVRVVAEEEMYDPRQTQRGGGRRKTWVPVHESNQLGVFGLEVNGAHLAIATNGHDVVVDAPSATQRFVVKYGNDASPDIARWAETVGVKLTTLGLNRTVAVEVLCLNPGDEVTVVGVVVGEAGAQRIMGASGLPVVIFAGDLNQAAATFERQLR